MEGCIKSGKTHATGSNFASEKARALSKVDFSRKGSVDEPIADLIGYLNSLEDFYTTSSCSGRLCVLQEDVDQRKKGCHWWLMSHDPITCQQLESSLSDAVGSGAKSYAFFKFEPFVLHVIGRTLEDAQSLMCVATSSGFRNSGISCGKKGKILVAVRSTQCLEVPLVHDGSILVSNEYLKHLVVLGNAKMQDNLQRIERFFSELKQLVTRVYSEDSAGTTAANKRSKTRLELVDKKERGDSLSKGIESRTEDPELDEVNIGHLFH